MASPFICRNALAFVVWAMERRTPPTPEHIRRRFGCSRATSFRWASLWNDIGEPVRLGKMPAPELYVEPAVAKKDAAAMNLLPGTRNYVSPAEVAAHVRSMIDSYSCVVGVDIDADGGVRLMRARGAVRYGKRMPEKQIAADLERRLHTARRAEVRCG